MTEPTLEEIEKALGQASPWPWLCDDDLCIEGQDRRVAVIVWQRSEPDENGATVPLDFGSEADAHLIAHSPEWLAYLLNRVKDQDAQIHAIHSEGAD